MSRWKKKRKRWHDRHARIGNRKKNRPVRIGSHLESNKPGKSTVRLQSTDKKNIVIQTPPKVFSLVKNPEETMSFFTDFKNEIDRNQYGTKFIVKSKDVEDVTVDALIYLIAILQNDKKNNAMHYTFAGDYPDNEAAKAVYIESGFTDYVKSNLKTLPRSNEKKRIISGINNNPKLSKDICDFVIGKLNKTRKEILPLQKVIVELMSNVYYHAYEKHSFMAKKWYMYAEHIDDYVQCIFVDTGFGIAKTVRKSFGEKIKAFFGIRMDDSRIIQSVFNGDFRTATSLQYRGNGLISVRENVRSELFESFEVFSGNGRCIIPRGDCQDGIITHCYENTLYGTLYQFIIR